MIYQLEVTRQHPSGFVLVYRTISFIFASDSRDVTYSNYTPTHGWLVSANEASSSASATWKTHDFAIGATHSEHENLNTAENPESDRRNTYTVFLECVSLETVSLLVLQS